MILINGRINNSIDIDKGINYGYGVFETVKVINKRPIFIKEHLKRLYKSASALDIGNVDLESIERNMVRVIDETNPEAIKINVLAKNKGYDEIIYSRSYSYTEDMYKKGFKLCISKELRNNYSQIVYHKTNNYMQNIIELRNAKSKGYNECIFRNVDGHMAEGAISNIFLIRDECIYTPSIDCGILNGIMRDKVIEMARDLGVKCIESKIDIGDIKSYDSMFITNSLMGIMPVVSLSDVEFSGSNITDMLSKELRLRECYD